MAKTRRRTRVNKNAVCPECGDKFDNGAGTAFVANVCDACYETRPWTGSYCCGKCKGKPRAFECSNKFCECGQHADMAQFLSKYPTTR